MRLYLVTALVPHFAHQGVQKTQQVQIVTLLRNGPGNRLHRRDTGVDDGLPRVRDDIDPERHAGDDDELPWLPDHAEMPAERHEAAQQAGDRDDETEENTQAPRSKPRIQIT